MGDLIQMRDFKRREEIEAEVMRRAKAAMGLPETASTETPIGIAAAPCELPQVWPDFQHSNEKEPA